MTISRAEMIELLKVMEETSPMKCVVVDDATAMERAVSEMAANGLRLAAVSNTGLLHGRKRLTFLPEDAFTDETKS